MKTQKALLVAFGSLLVQTASAQVLSGPGSPPTLPTTFAHWDLNKFGSTYPGNPSNLTLDCADSGSLHYIQYNSNTGTGINYSNTGPGSEGTSSYNCFGYFTDNIDPTKYVGFSVTFGNDVAAELDRFNFDVRGYTSYSANPSKIAVELRKNGSLVYSNSTVVSGLTTSWQDANALFGNGANFQSALGSTDTFEARLYAYDISGTPTGRPRIGLDNIRFIGTKVPEPSSALLSIVALAGLARRRR